MQEQESKALLMLNDLSLMVFNQLKATLNDPLFNDAKYGRLKVAVDALHLQKIRHDGNLRSYVLELCMGVNNEAKQSLINGLQFLQAKEITTLPMLHDLNLRELNQLKLVLNMEVFDDPKYDKLKKALVNVQKFKITAIRDNIYTTCSAGDVEAKKQLFDKLTAMDTPDRTMILSILTPRENKSLHDVLTHELKESYDNLRSAVKPKRGTLLFSYENTSKNRENPSSSRTDEEPPTKKRPGF